MSSSSYSRLDIQLRNLLRSLVSLEGLSIVSVEFTVTRDKEQPTLLSIEILLCEAEQKQTSNSDPIKNIGEFDPAKSKHTG